MFDDEPFNEPTPPPRPNFHDAQTQLAVVSVPTVRKWWEGLTQEQRNTYAQRFETTLEYDVTKELCIYFAKRGRAPLPLLQWARKQYELSGRVP